MSIEIADETAKAKDDERHQGKVCIQEKDMETIGV